MGQGDSIETEILKLFKIPVWWGLVSKCSPPHLECSLVLHSKRHLQQFFTPIFPPLCSCCECNLGLLNSSHSAVCIPMIALPSRFPELQQRCLLKSKNMAATTGPWDLFGEIFYFTKLKKIKRERDTLSNWLISYLNLISFFAWWSGR